MRPTRGNQVLMWSRAIIAGGHLAKLGLLESKLAFALTRFANYNTLELYPSTKHLAEAIGCGNLKRVRDALSRLEAAGLLRTVDRGGGRGRATTRQLVIPEPLEIDALLDLDPDHKQGRSASPIKQGRAESPFPEINRDGARPETGTVRDDKQGRSASPQPIREPTNELLKGRALDSVTPEMVFFAYPKKVKKDQALREIKHVLAKLHKRGQVPAPHDSWAAWLLDRVKDYAAARARAIAAGDEERYTSYPSNWFREGRYDDDPAEWESHNNSRKEKHAHGHAHKRGASRNGEFEEHLGL